MSELISEIKHGEFLTRIETDFKSVLEKKFGELETKFSTESTESRLSKPKIIGGAVEVEETQLKPNVADIESKMSPSPTVEEINNEPQNDGENEQTEQDVAE